MRLQDQMRLQEYKREFSDGFSLENEPHGQSEMDNNQLKAVVETDASQTMREDAARFEVTTALAPDSMKQIEQVKKLYRWIS